MKLEFEQGFLDTPRVIQYTKEEFRTLLLNKFAAKKFVIDDFINELIEFLQLKHLHTNEFEKAELKEIADTLALALGSLDQTLEDIIAFRQRIVDEKEMEDTRHSS